MVCAYQSTLAGGSASKVNVSTNGINQQMNGSEQFFGSTSNVTVGGTVTDGRSCVLSCLNCAPNSGLLQQTGQCAIIASANSFVAGNGSSPPVSGLYSTVISCQNCQNNASGAVMLCSNYTQIDGSALVPVSFSVVLGAQYLSLTTSATNRTVQFTGSSANPGIMIANGGFHANTAAPFPDYAETLPNSAPGILEPGLILGYDDNGAVRLAASDDDVIGVVSSTPAYVAGAHVFGWKGTFQRDVFGRKVMESVPDLTWTPGPSQTEADRPTVRLPKVSTDFDPSKDYVSQLERPEDYTVVALLGQPAVRVDATVGPKDYVSVNPAKPGYGTKASGKTRLRVRKITTPFGLQEDGEQYAVAMCFMLG